VAVVRRLLNRVKAGHTGTLDPQAEGVLPVCVGRGTKLAGYITAADKTYQAEIILGVTTDTYDHTGNVTNRQPVNLYDIGTEKVEQVIQSFVGGYEQLPPMYSAIKIKGKRLYEHARAGVEVERKARRVEIKKISIKPREYPGNEAPAFYPDNPRLLLCVDCGKGTYIRSLCADIGEKLGTGACMGGLVRTRSGSFDIKSAVTLNELKLAVEQNRVDKYIIPMTQAFPSPEAYLIDEEAFTGVVNGRAVLFSQVQYEPGYEYYWLYSGINLIGLYKISGSALIPEVMCYGHN
jgi:tRNA pseudouridine55 synthase